MFETPRERQTGRQVRSLSIYTRTPEFPPSEWRQLSRQVCVMFFHPTFLNGFVLNPFLPARTHGPLSSGFRSVRVKAAIHSIRVSWWTKLSMGRFFLWLLQFSLASNFIPPFLHTHLINFVSFHFIYPGDDGLCMVDRHPCYSQTFNKKVLHRISSLDLAPYQKPVEDIIIIHYFQMVKFRFSQREYKKLCALQSTNWNFL